jgi:hypothetical protein
MRVSHVFVLAGVGPNRSPSIVRLICEIRRSRSLSGRHECPAWKKRVRGAFAIDSRLRARLSQLVHVVAMAPLQGASQADRHDQSGPKKQYDVTDAKQSELCLVCQ